MRDPRLFMCRHRLFFAFQFFHFLQHTQLASQCLEVDIRVHLVSAQVENVINSVSASARRLAWP